MTIAQDGTSIANALTSFLETRLKTSVAPGDDLFASGLVASMFAMELVVHLEQSFGVMIVGKDLRLDNFRTVDSMTAMVSRLHAAATTSGG